MATPVPVVQYNVTLRGEHLADCHFYEFVWNTKMMVRITPNKNGTTGYATILASTDPANQPGKVVRIHYCLWNPCTAESKSKSKHGHYGEPMHLQLRERDTEFPAVAVVPGSMMPLPATAVPPAVAEPAVAEPAVAETSTPPPGELTHPTEMAPTEALPAEPAAAPPAAEKPPEGQTAATEEAPPAMDLTVEVLEDQVKAPDCPKKAALHCMHPPVPASPIDDPQQGGASATAVAVTAVVPPSVAAKHRIESKLLALAREIRTPMAYVGYSAFLLMGLLKKGRPCVWEGTSFIDLLQVFAPWALETCTMQFPMTAIACTLIAQSGGAVELAPICAKYALAKTSHYVAGIQILECEILEETCSFEALYASIGVACVASVVDGDCGLDVMTMMLGIAASFSARKDLRIEISDYLINRIGEPWLHDLMVACQELRQEDVVLYRSGDPAASTDETDIATPTAVADPAASTDETIETPVDEETFAAMRWASKLQDDESVLNVIRALPQHIVNEQVVFYRQRGEAIRTEQTAVAVPEKRISLCPNSKLATKQLVSRRFHTYCQRNAVSVDGKLPYGAMKTFIRDHIAWKAYQKKEVCGKAIRGWYNSWRKSAANVLAAERDHPGPKGVIRSMLGSRAPKPEHQRKRTQGGGRHYAAHSVRRALYEWWSGFRYAIDWTQIITESRSRGKKHLARFPREVVKLKARQLFQDHSYACLLNGAPVVICTVDSHWCRRWEEEHGLSMRVANRKYAVPRPVVKQRLEILWVVLFRLRLFISLVFGYDPLILNFDQSPFHHNETGSQNKPTLAVRAGTVPIVEGNNAVKSRWTGNFTTASRFDEHAKPAQIPAVECMFKFERDGAVNTRLQNYLRSRGFPSWFTVSVAPRGSYCECDIIAFLEKHLEPWREGRDWRILLCDDFSAHKTINIWNICWSRGYIRLVHGGGATPFSQTPDTDLNQHVRKDFGEKETWLLLEKMRCGQVVPALTPEEAMELMFEVMSNTALHKAASAGFKKVGQSIDLHGGEDESVCREAGVFWNEETTDKYPNMRAKINVELAAVAGEVASGGLRWCQGDVLRLITPYPTNKKVDQILEALAEDFYHDDVHALINGDDATAVADSDEDASDSSTDGGDEPVEPVGPDAIICHEQAEPSAEQVDEIQKVKSTIDALQATIEILQKIGQVSVVQSAQLQLDKERRKMRKLSQESPAVAESFARLRQAEDQESLRARRLANQHREQQKSTAKAIGDQKAAVAELRRTKRKIQDMESVSASRHALKTFTLEALGEGSTNAGGAKGKKNRHEVLDRLSRIRAGLSAGQLNDWQWFKEAWDKEMVKLHGAGWAKLFAAWMQKTLEDERSNAFSHFVYDETCRVFRNVAALHVPGS